MLIKIFIETHTASVLYEVCLKNNETVHITILFQTKNQNYNLSPSKYSPWALTHFPILFCHASIHSWKDFSGMPRSSFVTAFFMSPISLNLVPLMVLWVLETKMSQGVRRLIHNSNVFLARNFRMLKSLCDGALSWWSNHDFSSYNSCLFSRTDRTKRLRMSL